MSDADADLPDDLRKADPELLLATFAAGVGDAEDKEAVLRVAVGFAQEGVNIWRVMDDHPDLAADLVGVDVDVTDSLIATFDDLVEQA